MPIKLENKNLYPKNWNEISKDIRFNRADNRCEICGAINYSYVHKKSRELCLRDEDLAIQIVLTVAHLDHDPENCDYLNLKAMCQKCHNNYDSKHRADTRRNSKLKNQLSFSL